MEEQSLPQPEGSPAKKGRATGAKWGIGSGSLVMVHGAVDGEIKGSYQTLQEHRE